MSKYKSPFTVSETLFCENLLRLRHFEPFLFRGLSWMVFKRKHELSSWSQQNFFLFLQKYHLWPFSGTEVQLQSRFIQPRRNFWNNLEGSCWEHCGKRRVVCFSRPVSCACRHSPKSVNLASCIPAVRPFVACYAGFFIGLLICFTFSEIRFF